MELSLRTVWKAGNIPVFGIFSLFKEWEIVQLSITDILSINIILAVTNYSGEIATVFDKVFILLTRRHRASCHCRILKEKKNK
ncbi:hypothetical protein D5071_06725 [Pectobacterium carotovorum]|uniref:Uncharacterized protein n=1 Tax=Pectobacterium carotovorum TaxID=554 RepID=A0A419AY96_PECCA|nr:hypothetical protein D5071_06725 [Pectobacterium carotovorum]